MNSWEVLSVDTSTGHMIVEYRTKTGDVKLNVQMPEKGQDLAEYVSRFAPPVIEEKKFANVKAGAKGKIVQSTVQPVSESAKTVGSWDEEYLRAMIYQVLEEIRESSV